MGNRANVKLVDGNSTVFLYTHNYGGILPAILRNALAKKERWDDGQYLARIIFQEMLGSDKGTTGYGISSIVRDGSDKILVVDVSDQTVSMANKKWSFSDYLDTDVCKVWNV